MSVRRWVMGGAVVLTVASTGSAVQAQEAAFKAGVAVSRLSGDGATYWDESLTTTLFGGHVRFGFGPVALQPELYVATKGSRASAAVEEEQMRIEYIELPVLLVVPFRVGRAEPFVFGGPSVSLESRCRWVIKQDGLRTNLGCEPPPHPEVFERTAFDFGAIGGGGLAYPLGPGRLLLEARHNWGLRNIADSGGAARNRTFYVMLGYTLNWSSIE